MAALAFGVLSFRVLAVVLGLLIVPDSIGILTGSAERPPHSPKRNAAAWLAVSVGCVVGAVAFVTRGHRFSADGSTNLVDNAAVFVIWFGLSLGLLIRAAARSKQPWLVVASPVLLLAGWAGYVAMGGSVAG